MKTNIIFGCLLCLIFCDLAFAGDWGFYSHYAPCNWGCYYQPTSYSSENVPYYALHPPVYYSYPVARTYGDSPLPYPPGLSALQAYSSYPQPQMIKNEYVEEATPPMDQQYQTHEPLRISNPFVEQSNNAAMSKGVKWEGKRMLKPMVIYPAVYARLTK
ncbi:MAG: hypothetical protein ABSA26_10695 [Thermoguttaceae bacterium]|jgi:hypothetical protein